MLLSCLCGAPSLTRVRVCHLSLSICSNLLVFMLHVFYSSAIYVEYVQSFIQSRLSTADYALLLTSSSGHNGSLGTWTVVNVTDAKFEPFVFPVWGFALSDITCFFIFMIVNDFLINDLNVYHNCVVWFWCRIRHLTPSGRTLLNSSTHHLGEPHYTVITCTVQLVHVIPVMSARRRHSPASAVPTRGRAVNFVGTLIYTFFF
jgi:hypothetical protein